jgi:hypothetical protein
MGTKCRIQVLYVWLVDLQTNLLNTGWKRDFLQIMIFVYVCSTYRAVELKTRFETWIESNEVNGAYLFHFYYLINVLALAIEFTCARNMYHLSKSLILWLIG